MRVRSFLLGLVFVLGGQSSSWTAETDVSTLSWPPRDQRSVPIDNPAAAVSLSSTREASDSGWISHSVRVPAGQPLPIKASWTDDGKLRAELGDRNQVIAVRIHWTGSGDQTILRNPLSSMSQEEIAGLWGVLVEAWSDEIEQQLKAIDCEKTLLTVTQDWRRGTTNPLPPLPRETRYLRVLFNSSEGQITKVGRLKSLTELRYFELNGDPKLTFDFKLLSNCKKLEGLTVLRHQLENTGSLSSLRELRHLDLSDQRERLRDVGFVANLGRLETLDVSMNAIANLDSLAGLKHLKWVNADATLVERLPEKLALEVLRVQSTPLSNQQVAEFAKANPQCLIMHRWGDSLRNMVSDATRLVVRTHHFAADSDASSRKFLFESDDPAEIQEMVDGIKIDDSQSGFHCMCEGDPFLDFYLGDELLTTVGFHHGRSLRWSQGWWGDGMLTPGSGQFLVEWLDDRGVSGPADEIRQAQQQQRAANRKLKRAMSGLPEEVAQAFAERSEAFGELLRKSFSSTADQINALLRILGTDNNSWTQLDWIEQFADAELNQYDKDELALAVQLALRGEDRRARRGAARYWRSWRSALEDWAPENPNDLRHAVVGVMQDSHYYPLRIDAQRYVQSYHNDFSDGALLEIVKRGLTDPHPSVRRSGMLTAGGLGLHSVAEHLMRVLRGEPTATVDLPIVPDDETIDVNEGFDSVAGNRSEAEVAALALGYLHYAPAARFISQKTETSPMYEVALAMLGDHQKLKPSHFQLNESNVALQLAAVRVVIDTRGAHGLKWATEYQQCEYWWEEDTVASWLAQMLVSEQAPGADMLINCRDLETVAQWYQQHGTDYLKQLAND
ncbi:hypothetical protein CKO51_11790 [Rhodopirellula sp. SM50]|nr:leucine-rich repeat domain-containing protein [Rhodopirellula sp. SM50]PAY19291.1 hypothetical protein CKO51_11790 [Rhodopirellula sp. SM50]